jgi:hypothetical protein
MHGSMRSAARRFIRDRSATSWLHHHISWFCVLDRLCRLCCLFSCVLQGMFHSATCILAAIVFLIKARPALEDSFERIAKSTYRFVSNSICNFRDARASLATIPLVISLKSRKFIRQSNAAPRSRDFYQKSSPLDGRTF